MTAPSCPDRLSHTVETLCAIGDVPKAVHVFEPRQVAAVNAALAARRPLLVRGEPGIGKSQLARAAAKGLGRAFISHTVDARTEARDLLWHFDAVARLAEAQLIGALGRPKPATETGKAGEDTTSPPPDTGAKVAGASLDTRQLVRDLLQVERYTYPRPLWWAFNWAEADGIARQLGGPVPQQFDGGDWRCGCVLLIDEIDKAETDVPNGLLEALGAGCFHVPGRADPVRSVGRPPLVIITTNEERALPDAFVRRCLVLHLRLPGDDGALERVLTARGAAHFGLPAEHPILGQAARLLIADRNTARDNHWLPLPGQAEYLDLVRAVLDGAATDAERKQLLGRVAEFVLRKHPDAFRRLPDEAVAAPADRPDSQPAERTVASGEDGADDEGAG